MASLTEKRKARITKLLAYPEDPLKMAELRGLTYDIIPDDVFEDFTNKEIVLYIKTLYAAEKKTSPPLDSSAIRTDDSRLFSDCGR